MRRNELLVGAVVLAAVAAVVAGALWLGEVQLGRARAVEEARFRSVGGLGVGGAVTLRGVRIGRVDAIRLVEDDWVAVELRVEPGVPLPPRPAALAQPSSLFGEWTVEVVSLDQAHEDPAVRLALAEADSAARGRAWPGASLIDISQLAAKAGQIASDIQLLTGRVSAVFDSSVAERLRVSLDDLAGLTEDLRTFADQQRGRVDRTTGMAERGVGDLARAAEELARATARLDSATADGRLQRMLEAGEGTATDLRSASADLRSVTGAVRERQASIVGALEATDSILTRVAEGRGTLGMLARDSVLYHEATLTVRELRSLLADLQANPRKYFKFSVF